jgi:hypothetical protein
MAGITMEEGGIMRTGEASMYMEMGRTWLQIRISIRAKLNLTILIMKLYNILPKCPKTVNA